MMNAIGIPVRRVEKLPCERNDALCKAACLYGVPLYIYSLADIPAYRETGSIPALYWKDGSYHKCEIDLPKYTEIYCSITGLRKEYPAECSWLFEHTALTDDLALHKMEFQAKLQRSELMQYAIPTFPVSSYEELRSFLSGFSTLFLKPSSGRKAKGAMKVRNEGGRLMYSTPEGIGELTETAFYQYYAEDNTPGSVSLLLEPCLNILNDDGRAVDFRCLVSLNGEGKWQNVLTYARIGGSAVASNFSHGGSLNYAEDVLEQLIPGHGKEKLSEINKVALQVASFVQKESSNPVSWLGLDICMDRPSNQVYVIEANSKPGTKFVGPWPLSLIRAQYFTYLLKQDQP